MTAFAQQRPANPFMHQRDSASLRWENLTLEKRVRKVIGDIASDMKWADYGPLVMIGEQTIDDIATACTDGYNVVYGREFCMKQPEKALRFIVLHEARHKAGRDLETYRKLWDKCAPVANMAIDFANNAEILARDPNRIFIDLPVDIEICWDPKRFPAGMSPYEIFEELMKDAKSGGGSGQPSGGSGGKPLDDHNWEGIDSVSPDEQATREREVDRAVEQGEKAKERMEQAAGVGRNHDGRKMSARFKDVIIPWQDVLAVEFQRAAQGATSTTYGRVNRRHASSGVILPAPISEQIGPVLVACDTSGSVDNAMHEAHMGGMASLLEMMQPEFVDVLYWGTGIVGHERYEADQMDEFRNSTRPNGGGGTDIQAVQDWAVKGDGAMFDYAAIVVFTDGDLGGVWGKQGKWPAPVYWCISRASNWKLVPHTGITVPVLI